MPLNAAAIPHADLPGLLAEANRLLSARTAGGLDGLGAFDWEVERETWRQRYEAALPALTSPCGAVVTIVEELRAGQDPNELPAVLVPTRVEINGVPLLLTEEGPVVEKIETGFDATDPVSRAAGPVIVSMRMFARRVLIDAREQEVVDGGDGSAAGVAELEPEGSPAG